MRKEKINQAKRLIRLLMLDHNLDGWSIKVSKTRSTIAETFYKDKTIMFSSSFLKIASLDQLIGVTLHEIAHALVGEGHGHDKVFVDKCKEISPTDEYAKEFMRIHINNYIVSCPRCEQKGGETKQRNAYCAVCFNKDKELIKLESKRNPIYVKAW